MHEPAILLADGEFGLGAGKTSHGLVRGPCRYDIKGVVNGKHAGKDAGEVLDGKARGIPIYESIEEAFTREKIRICVIGVAPRGGKLTPTLVRDLSFAIQAGATIVSGLHELITTHPDLTALLEKHKNQVVEIRKPKPIAELNTWTGHIHQVKAPRLAILGTDCAVGKRTTCSFLYEALNAQRIKTQMLYTGQTGWLQGHRYGFILDSTLNDFVSGEMEQAIVACDQDEHPDIILLEGQSSLRNPSGPCGTEYIISAQAKGVILQHDPSRKYYSLQENISKMPSLQSEIELIHFLGAKVLAVTCNSAGVNDWQKVKQDIHKHIDLPVVFPKEEGVKSLLPIVQAYIKEQSHAH